MEPFELFRNITIAEVYFDMLESGFDKEDEGDLEEIETYKDYVAQLRACDTMEELNETIHQYEEDYEGSYSRLQGVVKVFFNHSKIKATMTKKELDKLISDLGGEEVDDSEAYDIAQCLLDSTPGLAEAITKYHGIDSAHVREWLADRV